MRAGVARDVEGEAGAGGVGSAVTMLWGRVLLLVVSKERMMGSPGAKESFSREKRPVSWAEDREALPRRTANARGERIGG